MPPEEQTGTPQQPPAQTHNDGLPSQATQAAGSMPVNEAGPQQQPGTDPQPQNPQGRPPEFQSEGQEPEGAPETYEFKAPEGQAFDQEFLKAYSETAKELNLSQDSAQKLIDRISPVIEQRQFERIQEIREGWEQSSRSDKEFGGEKLYENLGVANQFLKQHGTTELIDILNRSGLGNHPEIIRIFYRAGKAISPRFSARGPSARRKGPGPEELQRHRGQTVRDLTYKGDHHEYTCNDESHPG